MKSMFNKIKYLFLPVVLVLILFLTIPNSTYALIGTGVFDPFHAALEGIEEKAGPIAEVIVVIFFIYAFSLVILWVLTKIFDWVIWMNIEHVAVVDNANTAIVENVMVMHGWQFISGIANVALILILIVFAFSLILKIGSFELKKTLPKLIIVALLLNFSLVFIGMAIDVTNIFYHALLPPILGDGLMEKIMDPFLQGGVGIILTLIASFSGIAISLLFPFTAPWVQLGFVLTLPFILPTLIILIFQIIIFFILSAIFFLYIFIFAARIFIIQILAILSPLAFLCLILPQTKKYFDMWLKWLLEWLFVGIFLLFFLRLGFLIFGAFQQELALGITWFHNLGGYFVFYLFIFIYLAILAYMAKKLMPEFAQATINTAKGFGKWATMGWAVTGKHAFRHGIAGSKTGELGHQVSGWGKRIAEKGKRPSKMPGLRWARKKIGNAAIRTGTSTATKAEQSMRKEDEECKKKFKEYTEDQLTATANTSLSPNEKRIAIQTLAEKGKLPKIIKDKKISEDQVISAHKEMGARVPSSEEMLEIACPDLVEKFAKSSNKSSKDILDNIAKEIAKNPSNISKMDVSKILTQKDERMKQGLMKIYSPSMLKKIAETDIEAAEKLIEAIEEDSGLSEEKLKELPSNEVEIKINSFKQNRPRVALHQKNSPAFQELGIKNTLKQAELVLEQAKKREKEEEKTKEEESPILDQFGKPFKE